MQKNNLTDPALWEDIRLQPELAEFDSLAGCLTNNREFGIIES